MTYPIVYINFCKGIFKPQVDRLQEYCKRIDQNGEDSTLTIQINFASEGGDLDEAFNLYNFLKTLKCKLVTHNIGFVESAAVIVFLAGKERFANPYSAFLLHEVRWSPVTSTWKTYDLSLGQLEREYKNLEENQCKFKKIIKQSTKMEDIKIDEAFYNDTIIEANKALKYGIIQGIKTAKIEDSENWLWL